MIFNRQVTASGGAAPVLLWENTDQDSYYISTQWITLGGDYDAYIVETANRSNTGGPFTDLTYNYVPADGSVNYVCTTKLLLYGGKVYMQGNSRKILGVTRNSICFGAGYTSGDSSGNRFASIPYRIWGLNETI